MLVAKAPDSMPYNFTDYNTLNGIVFNVHIITTLIRRRLVD